MTILKTSKNHIVSKKRSVSLPLTATALSSAMLLAAGALAAEPASEEAKEAGKLKTIKVEADAIEPAYKAESVSSPKFTQPLVDTPQTIVVVKKELFQQQAATTLSETLRNTPGITMLMGENGNTSTGDSIFMRGFDTQGSIFVDGIRDLGSITRDTFNTEQVEIVKGPAGVDYGRGSASGYVNLSSKVANQEDATTGNVTVGSGDYARATMDTNKTLGETSAIRVNVMAQDAGVVDRDEVENNLAGLATSLGLGLGTETRTFINFLHTQQRDIPDGGISTAGLKGYYSSVYAGRFPDGGPAISKVDTSTYYGSSSDYNDIDATMLTVKVEHDLSKDMTLRNTSRYGRSTQDMVLTGVNALVIPADTRNDLDTWSVNRQRQGKDQVSQILTNQTNLTAAFNTGSTKHELTTGMEFIYESQFNNLLGLEWTSPTSTTRVSQAPANLYNPDMNDVFQPLVKDGTKTDGETTTAAFYVLDTVTLNPQWEISAGVRAERYYTKTDQIVRQAAATPQTVPVGTLVGRDAEKTDTLVSWKLGGVYKPSEDSSVYLSYATSYLPPGSANFNTQGVFGLNTDPSTTNANSPGLDPQKATNLELGTKWNVLDDKLALTAAIFKSTNENEIVAQSDGTSLPIGEREIQGIELAAVGMVSQAWQISAGFAYMDAEVIKGSSGSSANNNLTSLNGSVVQWTPEISFTLWNSYTFENGMMLGGGVRYVDSVASTSIKDPAVLATRSLVTIPDYWVVDAVASYPISNNLTVQLNIYNLADEDYIASVNNAGSRYFPGTPLSARLGLNFAF